MADSTFSTNSLRLLLLACVGITNTGMTFPVSYSFIRSEARDAFLFADKCMQQFVWRNNCPPPAIGITDQEAGYISVLAQLSGGDRGAAATAQAVARMGGIGTATRGEGTTRLQLCKFHVQVAILRHLTDTRGYTVENREKLKKISGSISCPAPCENWNRTAKSSSEDFEPASGSFSMTTGSVKNISC
jgi:hypothetical protein